MSGLTKIKPPKKARIGLYSAGLNTYWGQFEGLYDCLMGYNRFIEKRLSEWGEVFNFGMVDTEEKGREAGEFFNKNNVDIVFSHAATYYAVLLVLRNSLSVQVLEGFRVGHSYYMAQLPGYEGHSKLLLYRKFNLHLLQVS